MTNASRLPVVTIDGPAGAGKSTISKQLAARFGLVYIDTGAMFRAVALAAREQGIDWDHAEAVEALAETLTLTFLVKEGERRIAINGRDVETEIRQPAISLGASKVSAYGRVRAHLLKSQQAMGEAGGVLLEGRDTGTVVFPDADVKFYLDASARVRAERRFAQMAEENRPSLEELQAQIEARDRADSQRALAPLICPEDAHRIDSSNLSIGEVVEKMASFGESWQKAV